MVIKSIGCQFVTGLQNACSVYDIMLNQEECLSIPLKSLVKKCIDHKVLRVLSILLDHLANYKLNIKKHATAL